jgi:predicted membrane protein
MDADRWERKRERWERRWERRQHRWNRPGHHLFSGFIFVLIGLVFLLGNMGFLNVNAVLRFWPVILIAVGLFKLAESRDDYRSGSGVFWIVVGLLFLMNNFNILRIAFRDIWPVLLIGLGSLMLWRSVMARRERGTWTGPGPGSGPGPEPGFRSFSSAQSEGRSEGRSEGGPIPSSNSLLSATAILGGVKRVNNSQDFRGGDATAIMGGCEIDLRPASITPNHEPVLEVFAMWGGIEIRVPPDWTVISKVDPILGGFEDKTMPPKDESKRFVVRGSVVMGGIEVKN